MTITDCFKRIVKKQTEIGYRFPTILRPSATHEQIERTEKELGIKFNDELTSPSESPAAGTLMLSSRIVQVIIP